MSSGAPPETARLFVAITIPGPVSAALSALPRPAVPGLRWTTPDQWHITLRFLGDCNPSEADEALREVAWPVMTVRLGPATARLGSQILMLPAAGTDDAARKARHATRHVAPRETRRYRGHLTLARYRGRGRLPAALTGTPLTQSFPVESVALMESRLRPEGARYSARNRYPVPQA